MSNRPHRQNKLQTSPLPPLTGGGSGGLGGRAFFLRTKLLPPRPTPALLQRPRLMERLASNLAHPITLVAANAGSGKTTLVADFVRTHVRPFVWYQLDRTDADLLVFLGYLAHAWLDHRAATHPASRATSGAGTRHARGRRGASSRPLRNFAPVRTRHLRLFRGRGVRR